MRTVLLPFMMILFALTAGAWLILILSCAFAIRESTSAIERARARLLCFGALILPVIPTLLLARQSQSVAQAATLATRVCQCRNSAEVRSLLDKP